ncbi:MAG: asparagine synthase-related protein [Bacillota bacterium]|nr:asparagine synthase-related protein [Bacillota bacterium]
MSAIAGIYHLNDEPINLEHGRSLMKALEKFPADDIQVWNNEQVFFGCHAQWITPESIGEQLPYYDYEKQLAITADAIIDNREELFERLQVERSRQKAITDSELILLAYEKWGEDSPKFLVGDFAYMIWDGRKQQMFGARDFSGSRTLYYFFDQRKLSFCTVMNPLFELPYIDRNLNKEWLADFLANPGMFESVDSSSVVFKSLHQLPPSHSLLLGKKKLTLSRYCHLPEREQLILHSNLEYEEAFLDVYQRAITSRLRTYRKVGAHLSGGLDSGSVASIAAKTLHKENKQLHSFSYVPIKDFEDWTPKSRVANERPFIESTVEFVGNIKAEYLDFEGKSSFSVIDEWLEVLETPYKFFENTFWLKGIFERAKQEEIGILLNGQRGNWTVSWGPALEYQALLLKKFRFIHFFHEFQMYSKNLGVKKSNIASVVGKKVFPSLYKHLFQKEDYHFPVLINQDFANKMNVFEKLQEHGIDITGDSLPNWYEMREKQFQHLYYWNITGTYSSKLSLPYSLWDRDPTNDLRVVRFCLSVPENQYVQDGLDRALIRRSMKNKLPDRVRLNLRTRGAQGADGIPRMSHDWKNFIHEIEELCKDPVIADYINVQLIKNIKDKFKELPSAHIIYDAEFKILMRSLIFYRFMKNHT